MARIGTLALVVVLLVAIPALIEGSTGAKPEAAIVPQHVLIKALGSTGAKPQESAAAHPPKHVKAGKCPEVVQTMECMKDSVKRSPFHCDEDKDCPNHQKCCHQPCVKNICKHPVQKSASSP